jgi:hypothetical protein
MHFSKLLYMYQNQINTLLLYMSRTVTFLHASNQRRRGLNPTPKLLFRVRMPSRIQAKTHARAASGQTDRKTQGEKNTQGGPDRYAELAGVETRRLPVVRAVVLPWSTAMSVGSGSTSDSHLRSALVLVLLYKVVLMLAHV